MRRGESIIFVVFLLVLIISPLIVAKNVIYSNESVQAKEELTKSVEDIEIMLSKNISVFRANESYENALEIYNSQINLENLGKPSKYELVLKYTSEVENIQVNAVKADDELRVFLESYNQAAQISNLSDMDRDYNEILKSFREERFEDTIKLVNLGYQRISEIQSSQTAVKLFYASTTQTIKNFFIKNWLKLLIAVVAIFLFLLIFWKTLSKIRLKMEFNSLIMQKKTLYELIKQIQLDYFKKKTLSESEFRTKLKKFEEMIRDIERQIPLIREDMMKLGYKKIQDENERGAKKKNESHKKS